MNHKLIRCVGVLLVFYTVSGLAQQPAAPSVAAATRSEIDCAGFIAATRVPKDLYVFDGADNDFQSSFRQYSVGDSVYLRGKAAVGTEYSLVRPAKRLFKIPWYEGQGGSLRTLGRPYEDVGRIRVTRLTAQGAVAQVTFACGPIMLNDIAVPYQVRAIPEYTSTRSFDRFAPARTHRWGGITAAGDNAGFLGAGTIAYINLGSTDGVRPGQRFRIFRVNRDRIERWLTARPITPRESVGELVVLSTQEKSSAGMVVTSVREISVGDGIEAE